MDGDRCATTITAAPAVLAGPAGGIWIWRTFRDGNGPSHVEILILVSLTYAVQHSRLQRSWQPEGGEHAVVEAGHVADLGTGEGEHQQPVCMGDVGVEVAYVDAEGGLAVGPGCHEPVAAAGWEYHRVQESGHQPSPLVLRCCLRSGQQNIVGQQGDDLVNP